MTSGQLLPQSGLTGFWSGQQGMPSICIPAMLSVAVIMAAEVVAIAFSAAMVLTGAVSIPSNAQSDKSRMMANKNFITVMLGMRDAR